MSRNMLPVLLSLNGGYVDTAGFLALQGLFTAHVTGNFVTIGAALAFGTSGVIAKLLALPVFCLTVFLCRLLTRHIAAENPHGLDVLLWAKFVLLTLGCSLAIALGPFTHGDSGPAIITGMTLVVAMAIQNAVQRLHLGKSPPTTLMTGTTTQMMIDIADRFAGVEGEARSTINARMKAMLSNVGAFALGCAAAAALFTLAGGWCFLLPPVFAAIALWVARMDHAAG